VPAIICRFVTVDTEKQVLLVNNSYMEEKKEHKSQAIIEIIDFGPMTITGNFLIKDIKRDKEFSIGEARLCLCGKTGNKPYCDESHKK
jgi:hypothetical protein